jgi:hypothetical protein
MATDHGMTTLDDFSGDEAGKDQDDSDRHVDLGDARYGRGQEPESTRMRVETPGECQACGRQLSARYRRVQGDQHDVAWHCYHCVGPSAMCDGAGVERDYDGVVGE